MKKAFLFFVTGTDRAPIGGLSRVSIIIQKQGPDSNSLPSAQTCSGVLLIPEYRSHAKLKSKMELALKHKEGFGMQ
jgi:ubiquitin-protein ligase E3 A